MKQILIYISTLFLTLSCTSIKIHKNWYANLQYDVGRYTMDYYYTYLEYPNVEELSDYCWNLANSANDYRFPSYAEYKNEKKSNINGTGVEDFLHFLMNNQKDLSFKPKKGEMAFLWKSKIVLTFDLDYCQLQIEPNQASNFFCLFDSTATHKIIVDNDEEDFYILRNNVKQMWLSAHKLDQEVFNTSVLIRYNRKRGYILFCPTDSITSKNSYLEDMGMALDTFLLKRNAEMIQFVTLIPYVEKGISNY